MKLDNAESHAKVPVAQRETTQVTGDATRTTRDGASNDTIPQTNLNKPNGDSTVKEETNDERLNV